MLKINNLINIKVKNNIFIKNIFVIFFDTSLCLISLWFAFYLRLDKFLKITEIPSYPILLSLLIFTTLIFIFDIHKSLNRYTGIETFIELSKALVIYSIIFSIIFTFNGVSDVPRTIGIMQPIIFSLALLSSRALFRYLFIFLSKFEKLDSNRKKVMIYGAGIAGRQLANTIREQKDLNLVGFLDDDINIQGSKINNKIIYNPLHLAKLNKKLIIDLVFLAMPSIHGEIKNSILNFIQSNNISVRILPNLSEITSGKIHFSDLRKLKIDDLISREPSISPVNSKYFLIEQKIVLVTGGGGSIGSELCRQLVKSEPSLLIIIEVNEYALYKIKNEISKSKFISSTTKIEAILLSILDREKLEPIFKKFNPSIIFHAAAYKHVSIVEDNPIVGLENNVFGTDIVSDLAIKYKVKNFLLVSTDKAVRPPNIMGASKRLSEMIVQAKQKSSKNIKFSIVRFGNVLGSSGSVVPKFKSQIEDGGPITLTHLNVTRFFMSINEAVHLILESTKIAKGGEVFVLKMGNPVKIFDLAKKMIHLSGKTLKTKENLNGDIEIKVIGLSTGEKLHEELLIGNNPTQTTHKKILKANENFMKIDTLNKYLNVLKTSMKSSDLNSIKKTLQMMDTGYKK